MLETSTTEELFEEISKRTRNCILVFSIDGKMRNTVCSDSIFHGSPSEILGLLKYADLQYSTMAKMLVMGDREDY